MNLGDFDIKDFQHPQNLLNYFSLVEACRRIQERTAKEVKVEVKPYVFNPVLTDGNGEPFIPCFTRTMRHKNRRGRKRFVNQHSKETRLLNKIGIDEYSRLTQIRK